jgi:hypothetical protein
MNDEIRMMWEDQVVAHFKVVLQSLLERTKESHVKNLSEDVRHPAVTRTRDPAPKVIIMNDDVCTGIYASRLLWFLDTVSELICDII